MICSILGLVAYAPINSTNTLPVVTNTAIIGATPSIPPMAPTTLPSAQVTKVQNQQLRWLQGIPCRPPCWEGITPGKTTAAEATKLLQQSNLTKLPFKEVGGNFDYIKWSWAINSTVSTTDGYLIYPSNSPTSPVAVIFPKFPVLMFRDVIQAYGEPSHFFVAPHRDPHLGSFEYYYYAIYLSQGFMVYYRNVWEYDKNAVNVPNISPETLFTVTAFFVPGVDGAEKAQPSIVSAKRLIAWKGFKDWRYYCNQYDDWGQGYEVRDCSNVK